MGILCCPIQYRSPLRGVRYTSSILLTRYGGSKISLIFDCFHLQALRLSIETLWQSATTVQPQPIIECQFDSKMCAAVEMEGHWGVVHLDGKIENRRPKCCLTCRRNGCGHTQSYNKSIGLFDHIDFSGANVQNVLRN